MESEKVKTFMIVFLSFVLVAGLFYIGHNMFNTSLVTGEVVSPEKSEQNLLNNTNVYQENPDPFLSQAITFYKECLFNCSEKCDSCIVLNTNCVLNCQDEFDKKATFYQNMSYEEVYNLIGEENLNWISCLDSCTSYLDNFPYISIDCLDKC